MPRYSQSADAARAAAEQAEFNEKKWVWVPDEENGYLAGWVVTEDDETAEVQLAGTTRHVSLNSLSKMNPPKFDRVDDIADLTFLNEASVVHNLRLRYLSGAIYTYSGLFLVAINPYTQLPLYTDAIIEQYRYKRRDENPPHIFAIAERAWISMGEERENQSILITGESGAGKTENTKKVIQYLAAIATDGHNTPSHSRSSSTVTPSNSAPFNPPATGLPRPASLKHKSTGSVSLKVREKLGLLERQILQANPILEAFGNAQTARNNNSSRFGKFVRISFTHDGSIAGANVDWYLLEKSRVVVRSEVERNFHVFYQLLAGGDDLLKRLLIDGNINTFEYLNKSRTEIDGVNDREEWRLLQNALDTVGLNPAEQFDLFRIVAAILHIGNIDISGDRSDQAHMRSPAKAEKVCHLLGIPVQKFTEAVLRPRVLAGREWVTQARTKQQALDELSALCKTLYEKSFGALVDRINRALDRPSSKSTFIGVLDIAGFEIFEVNAFEQLCINYTNEKLQQFFNHHMFVLEQEEYRREHIEWDFVNFGLDLQPTIDLIESSGNPIGILSCLDEECIMPRATDATFTHKLNVLWATDNHGETPHPGKTKYATTRFEQGFTIQHYAGRVEYRTEGWLEKNKDPLNDNLTRVLAVSTERYVSGLFAEFAESSNDGGRKRILKKGAFRTVGQRHKEQLNNLMAQLQATQPHFVRCIVPNPNKRPGQVDVPLVLDQLRCNGVLEGIRIARLGYPNRLPFTEFRYRYEILTPGIIPRGYMEGRKACLRMVDALELDAALYKIGTSKIFFKAGVLADLEERRDALLFDIFSRVQAVARMWTARRQMKKILNRAIAIRTIQRNAKMYADLKEWPWWQLYTKVRPMLTATRNEEELRRKETELALAKERAERDKQEREALQKLKMELESEKRKVEEQLETERNIALEKDRLLERSKKQESDLADEVVALQQDLETVDQQLDAAMKLQKETEDKRRELQLKFEEASNLLQNLESAETSWKEREKRLTTSIQESEEKINALSKSRDTHAKKSEDLKQKLADKEQDIARVRERMEASVAELENKLAQETKARDATRAKLESLEEESRQVNVQLVELSRTATDSSNMIQKKEADISRLTSELAASKKDKDTSAEQVIKLENDLEVLVGEYEAQKADRERDAQARAGLQRELDELRRKMAAKASEDSKILREIEKSKEQELASLRSQSKKLQDEVADVRRQSSEAQNKLKQELETAQHRLKELETSHRDLTAEHTSSEEKKKELEASLAETNKTKRVAEAELQQVRTRQIDLDSQLEEAVREKEGLQRQLTAAHAKHQEYEDTVLQVEREKTTWTRQIETLKKELEVEANKRVQLAKNATGRNTEAARLRDRVALFEKDIIKLQRDLGDRDWQIKQLKASQNKTIVEHVHVLQEAKKRTDIQLEDAQKELAAERTRVKALETTKARLMGEAEDATRLHQQELIALRSVDRNIKGYEQQASKATADVEREKKLREATELQANLLQTDLQAAREQVAELELELQNAAKSKENLETELANLAADGNTASADSLIKMRRDYEARIAQLESQVEDGEIARSTAERIKQKIDQQHAEIRRMITSSGPRDNFRERLLKEIQAADDALSAEFSTRSLRHGKRASLQIFGNMPPSKRTSMPSDTNGLARARKDSQSTIDLPQSPDRQATQLKQQVQALELRIVASDRVRQHLESSLKGVMADLEKSDGSKQSLQAYRAKLAQDNTRLGDLLNQEAEARRAAEASQIDGINAMWKKFQSTIENERVSYTKLEDTRKGLLAQQRSAQLELEEHKRSSREMHQIQKQLQSEVSNLKDLLEAEKKAKSNEEATRRRAQEQLQELQVSTAASNSRQGDVNTVIESYKAKADSTLAKLEAAEIARAKAVHEETLVRKALNDAAKVRDDAVKAREATERRLAEVELRAAELETRLEEESREYADMELFRRRVKEEMEDERDQYQKDLAERDFTIEQTRQKYHAELLQLSEDSRHLRDTISNMTEENHKMRSELTELQLQYDDEVYTGSSWKKEKDRMTTKITDLTGAYESSKVAQAEQQNQIVALLSQVRELRAVLDEAEAERTALRKARSQLESRLNNIAQDNIDASKMSSDRVVQELTMEKQDLRSRLEEQADRVALANERLKKTEGFASDLQVDLTKVRHTNSELERQNAVLEKSVKELNVKLVEYETKAFATAPRPSASRRQDARIEELTARLAQEEKEKTEHAKLQRSANKSAQDFKFQLVESDRQRLRLEEELKGSETKVTSLRQEYNDLLKSESELRVSKRRAELEAQDLRQKYLNSQRELETLRGRLERPGPRRSAGLDP